MLQAVVTVHVPYILHSGIYNKKQPQTLKSIETSLYHGI